MNRRQFITFLAASSVTVVAGGYAYKTYASGKNTVISLTHSLNNLKSLDLTKTSTRDGWNVAQVFTHLAQSIEYSMTGYPEHKSDIFKQTLGKAAFTVFTLKGSMNHGLDEPIPSAPMLKPLLTAQSQRDVLISAIEMFQQYTLTLKPHFAYGDLTKAEYEVAHVLHINNHLENFITL